MAVSEEFLHQDMPFEERCAGAKLALAEFWNGIKNITGDGINFLQDVDQRTNKIRQQFANNPAALEFLERLRSQSRESVTTDIGDLDKTWEGALSIARLAWGSDAVDFAVSALQHEAKTN